MQLRTAQYDPLPNDLQDIVLSYLPEEDKKILENFVPYTLVMAQALMMWPILITGFAMTELVPKRYKIPAAIVGPSSLIASAGISLAASTITIPVDVSRYARQKISAKIDDNKNQHWASFFMDVERTPKNIHHIIESRKRKRE